LAGLILLFCAITSPLKLVFLASSEKLVTLGIVAIITAAVVRSLANLVLRGRVRPWHTRPLAPLFLLIALVIVNTLLHVAERIAVALFGVDPVFSSATVRYVLLALQLAAVAVVR
jgi:hypothetical protein